MKKKLFFILLLFLVFVSVYSQRKLPVTVTLDTKTWTINDIEKLRIPFDENFYISGNFDEKKKVSSLVVKYRLKDHCEKLDDDQELPSNCRSYYKYRNHYYFYKANGDLKLDDGYVYLDKINFKDGNNTFEILMDPLHPNEVYELVFEYYEKKNLTNDDQKELKAKIVIEINKAYDYKLDETRVNDFDKLNQEIEKVVTDKFNGSKFYDSKNKPISFEDIISTEDEVEEIYDLIYASNNKLNTLYKGLSQHNNTPSVVHVDTKALIANLDNNRLIIKKAIDKILSYKQFSKVIKEPVNSTVDSKISLKEVLEFISSDLNRWANYSLPTDPSTLPTNRYLVEIIYGRSKMKGKVIEPVVNHNLKSMLLLWSAFDFLQNSKYINGSEVIPFNLLKSINENLLKWCADVKEFNRIKEVKSKEAEKISDLYTDVYSKFNAGLTISTKEVLETKESNYLGLDFGLLIAPEIGSSFVFEGFNFYFRPVNKNVSSSKLKGIDKTLKTFSISLGIAQRIGSYDDNYEALIGVGSPFVGVGYRLNKNIRLSAGGIFYEVSNPNPLISDTSVKFTYFLSLSWDISFKDLIKTVIGI